jgi:type IV pilus assembly protein PilA
MAQTTNPLRRTLNNQGFTLIELMVVVVIIGVLSTLAVVGYRKLVDSSHATEASHMVQAIRVAQESYRAETGSYHHPGWDGLCPTGSGTQTAPSGKIYRNWEPACNAGGSATWERLPVHADGPVAFGYGSFASGAGRTIPASFGGIAITGAPATPPVNWFIIGAMSDIDGAGAPFTTVVGTSFSNQVAVFNEGY